ncbi:possible transcriptional regulator, AraC family (plasmid) [Rhodococcus jostii RHA1]|uniref:Possible transcriptional regulator, AraC family n=1 Tax=Rhodococcus jostii (strain RHA1) TaxID=101510 RepID=Q0RUS5_RHOJR|nr:AraC family transcriptional regulator [Rhodococcus jostii]ABH00961.1 possible transcriptional regulator, AraC family [Rhodococcus jostii RHA1]
MKHNETAHTGRQQRSDAEVAAIPKIGESSILCVTNDLDEFRASLNTVFYPADIGFVGSRTRVSSAELSAVRLNYLTIGRARFGSEARVDPGDLGTYHVNVPLEGSVVSVCGSQQMTATPQHAAVFSPNEHTILPRWDADATQICIKIDRAGLQGELAQLLGRPIDQRIRFDLALDLTTPAGARWLSLLNLLLSTLDDPGLVPTPGLAAHVNYLERALIAGLLVHHTHSMSAELNAPQPVRSPHAVQKVLDQFESVPGAQYTIGDLAAIAGIGARQLQKLFQDQFGMPPSVYLRHLRLDGVRHDLLLGDENTTVGHTAFKWGFNHLGRFANSYEDKFGESPSHTLRAAIRKTH